MELSNQFVEAASWHLGSELVRRDPTITLIQTHPGGGQYDCLELFGSTYPDDAAGRLCLNRAGSLSIFNRFDGTALPTESEVDVDLPNVVGPGMLQVDIWPLMARANSSRDLVERVARIAGLPTPSRVPPSTPSVLAMRVLAAIAKGFVFAQRARHVTNGFLDTSGSSESRLKHELFARFPEARREVQEARPGDFLGNPGYRYWFVTVDHEPALCASVGGLLWTAEGQRVDLMAEYQAEGRDLGRLVARVQLLTAIT